MLLGGGISLWQAGSLILRVHCPVEWNFRYLRLTATQPQIRLEMRHEIIQAARAALITLQAHFRHVIRVCKVNEIQARGKEKVGAVGGRLRDASWRRGMR